MKNTLKLYELKIIDKCDRIGIVLDDGTFIAGRQTDKLDILLYNYRDVCFFELFSDRIENEIFKASLIVKLNYKKLSLMLIFLKSPKMIKF
jgi:hypothetical protein